MPKIPEFEIPTEQIHLEPATLPLKEFAEDPNQPRREKDFGNIEDLGKDMAERGQLCPVLARKQKTDGKHVLLDGGRRYRGAKAKRLKFLSAYLCSARSELGLLESQFIANFKREHIDMRDNVPVIERYVRTVCEARPEILKFPLSLRWKIIRRRLEQLTGSSPAYFEALWHIVRSKDWLQGEVTVRGVTGGKKTVPLSKMVRQMVQRKQLAGYALKEIAHASDDPAIQAGLAEVHIVAAEKNLKAKKQFKSNLGANYPRALKKVLTIIGQQKTTPEAKQNTVVETAKHILILNGDERGEPVTDKVAEGRFNTYCALIDEWHQQIERWSPVAFSKSQCRTVASKLHSLEVLWMSLRQTTIGEQEVPTKHKLGTK